MFVHNSGHTEEKVIPAEHSKLYLWDDPLLKWQLQWQVLGEAGDTWTTVEVNRSHDCSGPGHVIDYVAVGLDTVLLVVGHVRDHYC